MIWRKEINVIKHFVESKPLFVTQIFDQAENLCLPTIQRQFVWDEEKIKKLIDSINRQYPIGAIIIWSPSDKFPSVPLYDNESTDRNKHFVDYIIDGQQRITALLLMKNNWQITRDGKPIITDPIYYLPETKKFRSGGRGGIDVSLIVRASLADMDAIKQLQNGKNSDAYKKYETDIKNVGKRIVNFPIPFYYLKSQFSKEDYPILYNEIAEIFIRVNSEGVKLSGLEMFLSFFAGAFSKETVKVKQQITESNDKYDYNYGLDLEPILRFVFSNLGRDQNEITNIRRFPMAIERLKEDFSGKESKMNKIVLKCDKAIGIVLELITKEIGIETTKYFPSQNALLPLFQYIYNNDYATVNEITQRERNKIIKWFLIASFNGIYSNSPNPKIKRDIDIMNKYKRFPIKELLSAMKEQRGIETDTIEKRDIINAYEDAYRGGSSKYYLMLLTALLYRNEATNWASEKVRFSEVHDRNTVTVHHIFPQEELMKDDPENENFLKNYVNCIGNLTLVSSQVNGNLSDTPPEEYLLDYETELNAHLIPPSRKLWKIDKFEDFIDKRLHNIWKATVELLTTLDK